VGDLFTAGSLPGRLLAAACALVILLMAAWCPQAVFTAGAGGADDAAQLTLAQMAAKLLPIVLLIGGVLGGLYAGWFTATEAGAVGAAMALAIALLRRKLGWRSFGEVLRQTGHVTVAVSFLIICASIYTRMLAMSGTPQALVEWMAGAGLGVAGFLLLYVLIVLLLGTVVDSSSIMLIVLPLMLPVAEQLGLNLIWFGVVTVVAVEIGLLTPPFGLSAYVVKSTLADIAPVTLGEVFRGTLPFTLVMIAVLGLLLAFPQISLVLLR
ncbi:MAG TPA: TRAP transporter large permease subunit, partial [Rubrivivax sp.]|nr:TRAP transporter large permease subunit [Rubrivivax sp.]